MSTDRADEIAREIAGMIPEESDPSPHTFREIEDAIAAALRSYADEKLEEGMALMVGAAKMSGGRVQQVAYYSAEELLRSLKTSPSTQENSK